MSEIRALLLTDVVDSTKLSQELGDHEMSGVWLAHDRIARSLLDPWRGREIDKSDGMLLLFDKASDAIGYAMSYHEALASLHVPLQARAGLHVGAVMLRENAPADVARGAKPLEVEGLAKPIAARVMALAQAGQTLLTAQARDDLGKTALKVVSHGHWMVKGVADPIELFEAGEPTASFVHPPDGEKAHRVVRSGDWWLPIKDIANNLPNQPTSFIGRERELREVKDLLGSARLVTLLGMGGLGKTRLSLQAAAELIHVFPDGVWFFDLAPISDATLVISEAAQVLGLREEADRPLLQTLCSHLKTHRALLVFDNCEHLLKPSAQLAAAILKTAPHVRVLASSRESLRAPGEQTYPVMPLPVPVPGKEVSVEALSRSTAVRLFVARVQLHRPSFKLDEREAPQIAELVARLEGIPLALELAAARIRSLTLADINKRLKDRYKLLTGGSHLLQERQQTLRALVDWSYELLDPSEQVVLARLATFVGGFDLPAAEAVCGCDPVTADDVLDLLESLCDKSLVMLEERDEGARYRMLETIRDYAREKLDQADDVTSVTARHCEHYFALAKEANRGLRGPQQADWIWKLEVELDNIRSAFGLALAGGVDPIIAVKFAVAMQGFWILRGYSSEGRKLVRATLALPVVEASAVARGWSLYVGAALAESQGDHSEARLMLETCLTLRRELGNEVDIAATLSTLSIARLQAGDAEGAAAAESEALQIFQRLGDLRGEGIGLLHLGQIYIFQGNDSEALQLLTRCLSIAREIKHQELEAECELVLGVSAFESGELGQADLRFKRSLNVCREAGDKRGEVQALWWLGQLDLHAGEISSARARLCEALRAFRAFEAWADLLGCLEDHAMLAHAEGRSDSGGCLAAVAAKSRQRLGLRHSPRGAARWRARLGRIDAAVPELRNSEIWLRAQDWQIDDAIRHALSPEKEPATAC